jgi:ferric-dicitrate binding protein FerR (iron transport regulator)
VRAFLENELNETEQQEFYQLLKDPAQRELLSEIFMELNGDPDLQLPFDESLMPVLKAVMQADRAAVPVVEMYSPKRSRRWIWIAAAVLLLLTTGTWLFFADNKNGKEEQHAIASTVSIPPGSDGAILTLADGSKMLLDSLADGVIARQQGADLVLKNRELAYESKKNLNVPVVYNTITTPRGRQYQFQLSDGTGVWLNAGSSITFPTAFSNTGRNVKITGEVYFEVAKKMASGGNRVPFTVSVNDPADAARNMDILVLGTHFNVNAYADEPQVNTTLLEGSIQLKKNNEQYLLLPGQQARLQNNGTFKMIDRINAEEVLAWKDGFFYFDHTDLQTVMRQLSRWYDVSVEYRGEIPDLKFVGEIPRSAQLDQVFQILGKTKLRFTVDNKKIIVHP